MRQKRSVPQAGSRYGSERSRRVDTARRQAWPPCFRDSRRDASRQRSPHPLGLVPGSTFDLTAGLGWTTTCLGSASSLRSCLYVEGTLATLRRVQPIRKSERDAPVRPHAQKRNRDSSAMCIVGKHHYARLRLDVGRPREGAGSSAFPV